MTRTRALVRAAGCIVWRYGSNEPEVLLVHRPGWKDWTFPKGKLIRGESPIPAAVREVEEETGLRVWLGPRLRDDHYTISSGQPKVVSYWCAQPPRKADVTRYRPNSEIDKVEWFSLTKARRMLTYSRDVELLGELGLSAYDSSVLLVVRHVDARKRKGWHGEDQERPLSAQGRREAERLADVLAAYGVTRVVTSDAVRCVETMLHYLNRHSAKVALEPWLSEERFKPKRLAKVAARALTSEKRMAICTHRPVLPALCGALGIEETALSTGGMIVIHRANGKVLSVEKPE